LQVVAGMRWLWISNDGGVSFTKTVIPDGSSYHADHKNTRWSALGLSRDGKTLVVIGKHYYLRRNRIELNEKEKNETPSLALGVSLAFSVSPYEILQYDKFLIQ
jgi:hypothetical protein